jgi:alkyl sulfatase BDS1-like metallo-beta-lactamase superfamily hydrolase
VSADPPAIDVATMTAEEFVALVKASSDDEVRSLFRTAGTAAALDRIFGMMTLYFRPERAGDVDAAVQWRIRGEDVDHLYVVRFTPEGCTSERGTVESPTATISTDLVRFARIVSGQANAVKLLLTRKLKASGDVMFAKRIDSFFDIPGT